MMNMMKSTGYALALCSAIFFTGCAADGSDDSSEETVEEAPAPSSETAPATSDYAVDEDLDVPVEGAYDSDSDKGLRDRRYCWLYMPGGSRACRYLGSVTKAGAHIRCSGWVAASGGFFYKYSLHEGQCSDVTGG